MVQRLYLVRHAMPVVDPVTTSVSWPLDAAGRASAAEAARAFPDGDYYWVSSGEPKAWQTAESMTAVTGARQVHRDSGFAEVHKPYVFTPRHRQLASSYVSGAIPPGWEPHWQVRARFDAAVHRHLARAGDSHLVIATHGMAMTIWLAGHIDLGDPARFWRGLALPDVIAIDPPTRKA